MVAVVAGSGSGSGCNIGSGSGSGTCASSSNTKVNGLDLAPSLRLRPNPTCSKPCPAEQTRGSLKGRDTAHRSFQKARPRPHRAWFGQVGLGTDLLRIFCLGKGWGGRVLCFEL